MATLNNFWGAETGGTEEAFAINGTATTDSSIVHTGNYSFEISGATDYIDFSIFESIADAGGSYCFGAWIYLPTQTNNEDIFLQIRDSTALVAGIKLDTDNNKLSLVDANLSVVGTSTNEVIVRNNWHFIEVWFENSATGSAKLFIDTSEVISVTSQDFSGTITYLRLAHCDTQPTVTRICYYDDIYFMSACTDETDRLGGCEVVAYRSNRATALSDYGTVALTSGVWSDAQEIPFSDTNSATIDDNNGTVLPGVITNDVGGSGTGGPATDSNLNGSIIGAKGIWRAERGNGGGTTLGHAIGKSPFNSYTYYLYVDVGSLLTTSPANYTAVTTTSTHVPTTSQYGVIGFWQNGAKAHIVYDMLATYLHVPTTPSAPIILSYPRKNLYRTLLTR